MKLRSQTRASQRVDISVATQDRHEPALGWPSLPAELRIMTLNELKGLISPHEKKILASLAIVSKEWRPFFEPLLWQALIFRPSVSGSGFQGFHRHIKRRGHLVRKVALHVRVDEPFYLPCQETDPDVVRMDLERFTADLRSFFSYLADWPRDTSTTGIALELGVINLNDAQHRVPSRDGRSRRHHCHCMIRHDGTQHSPRNLGLLNMYPIREVLVVTSLSVSPTLRPNLSYYTLDDISKWFPRAEPL
ncbi:hypothetical protein CDEST_00278 [Colletotrichum destructivum]|uniref:F-box domain-containing protein n=1 Tax=Colletotrichum destructivum TaxID=34406 RepID=A0AAX4HWY0_9PEZI|nr:hypothetical protein CDEST_00278 [Colletotrichum destructivum]